MHDDDGRLVGSDIVLTNTVLQISTDCEPILSIQIGKWNPWVRNSV